MPSHRSLRIAEAIREVVSSAILFEVADPRVAGVTVLRTDVSGDLHNATVFVSVMGSEADQRTAMRGLQSAAGFLQAKVAARLQSRTTPHLVFKRDVGIKRSVEMSQLIDDALAADRAAKGDDVIAGLRTAADAGAPDEPADTAANREPAGNRPRPAVDRGDDED